jgi:hypothetical protein
MNCTGAIKCATWVSDWGNEIWTPRLWNSSLKVSQVEFWKWPVSMAHYLLPDYLQINLSLTIYIIYTECTIQNATQQQSRITVQKWNHKQCLLPRNRCSNLPRDTQVWVTLVARPLLTPVAQKLYKCEHGVFTSKTCVHSRTLLRIKIVYCCSWSI